MPSIDTFLIKMLERGASDLHISSNKKAMIRESGEMKALTEQKIPADHLRQLLFEIMPDRNRREFEEIWDTDFAYEIEGHARFRGNVFMDRFGIGGVFRQIPSEVLTAEQLNLPPAVINLCYLSKGFVVVTGPTGSGKSTTLAAMIDFINKSRADHLITIEDPIEFVHQDIQCLINQREVHRHTKNFKNALRAALRQDPDIVLVGEMRDLETIEIAIETAETGHLVFGTLHTNTAPSTVDRIIDQFPTGRQTQIRTMLSSSLKGVIAQTLCKKKPKGRVAALEILVVTGGIANMIRDGKTYQIPSAMQTGMKSGMILLNDSLLKFVKEGSVDPMEAYMKATSKEDLVTKFKQNMIPFTPPSSTEHRAVDSSSTQKSPSLQNPSSGPATGPHAVLNRPRPSSPAPQQQPNPFAKSSRPSAPPGSRQSLSNVAPKKPSSGIPDKKASMFFKKK